MALCVLLVAAAGAPCRLSTAVAAVRTKVRTRAGEQTRLGGGSQEGEANDGTSGDKKGKRNAECHKCLDEWIKDSVELGVKTCCGSFVTRIMKQFVRGYNTAAEVISLKREGAKKKKDASHAGALAVDEQTKQSQRAAFLALHNRDPFASEIADHFLRLGEYEDGYQGVDYVMPHDDKEVSCADWGATCTWFWVDGAVEKRGAIGSLAWKSTLNGVLCSGVMGVLNLVQFAPTLLCPDCKCLCCLPQTLVYTVKALVKFVLGHTYWLCMYAVVDPLDELSQCLTNVRRNCLLEQKKDSSFFPCLDCATCLNWLPESLMPCWLGKETGNPTDAGLTQADLADKNAGNSEASNLELRNGCACVDDCIRDYHAECGVTHCCCARDSCGGWNLSGCGCMKAAGEQLDTTCADCCDGVSRFLKIVYRSLIEMPFSILKAALLSCNSICRFPVSLLDMSCGGGDGWLDAILVKPLRSCLVGLDQVGVCCVQSVGSVLMCKGPGEGAAGGQAFRGTAVDVGDLPA